MASIANLASSLFILRASKNHLSQFLPAISLLFYFIKSIIPIFYFLFLNTHKRVSPFYPISAWFTQESFKDEFYKRLFENKNYATMTMSPPTCCLLSCSKTHLEDLWGRFYLFRIHVHLPLAKENHISYKLKVFFPLFKMISTNLSWSGVRLDDLWRFRFLLSSF